jgi:hypothetical protein
MHGQLPIEHPGQLCPLLDAPHLVRRCELAAIGAPARKNDRRSMLPGQRDRAASCVYEVHVPCGRAGRGVAGRASASNQSLHSSGSEPASPAHHRVSRRRRRAPRDATRRMPRPSRPGRKLAAIGAIGARRAQTELCGEHLSGKQYGHILPRAHLPAEQPQLSLGSQTSRGAARPGGAQLLDAAGAEPRRQKRHRFCRELIRGLVNKQTL